MARCTRCGAQNPDYVFYCGKCGGEVTKDENAVIVPVIPSEPPKGGEQAKATETSSPQEPEPPRKKCTWCGKEVNASAYLCPFCGKNPWGPWGRNARDEALYQTQIENIDGPGAYGLTHASGGLTLGGILAIIAGVLALGQGLLYSVIGSTFAVLPGSGSLCLCGSVDALFGALSILGGISALKRSNWALALFGAILGMLGIGLLIGALLGLIALILIAMSRNEFDS